MNGKMAQRFGTFVMAAILLFGAVAASAMGIFVKLPNGGGTITLDVVPGDTVGGVKNMIQDRERIPAAEVWRHEMDVLIADIHFSCREVF